MAPGPPSVAIESLPTVAATPDKIGVISDTHGYLDPYVLEAFAGVDRIVHAGDIGDASILSALEGIAPVTAVVGNLDGGALAQSLPTEAFGVIGDGVFVVGHKRKRLAKRLMAGKLSHASPTGRIDMVVFGHEHMPTASWVDGTLYLNPGSATSPYEEDDAPTVAVVEVGPTGLSVRFVPLKRHHITDAAVSTAGRNHGDNT